MQATQKVFRKNRKLHECGYRIRRKYRKFENKVTFMVLTQGLYLGLGGAICSRMQRWCTSKCINLLYCCGKFPPFLYNSMIRWPQTTHELVHDLLGPSLGPSYRTKDKQIYLRGSSVMIVAIPSISLICSCTKACRCNSWQSSSIFSVEMVN